AVFRDLGQHPQTLIVNLKTEGIEQRCLDLLTEFRTPNWFFLDMSTPFLIQYLLNKKKVEIAKEGLAVRWSEYESLEFALKFKEKISWIWVDCFTKYPDWDCPEFYALKKQGLKFCLVAPELQSHPPKIA